MSKIDDGGPAFPMPPHTTLIGTMLVGGQGATLRDLAALHALTGYCASHPDAAHDNLARWSYDTATAFIAEKRRRESQ